MFSVADNLPEALPVSSRSSTSTIISSETSWRNSSPSEGRDYAPTHGRGSFPSGLDGQASRTGPLDPGSAYNCKEQN